MSSLGSYLGALQHPILRIIAPQELAVYGFDPNTLSIYYLIGTI